MAIVGRGDGPGKPLQYGTSSKFMDYFGLKSIEDLPQPKDFREPDNEIGEKAPIDEETAEKDHSTSDPAALRAKVAANLDKAAAEQKRRANGALVTDIFVAVAITGIIADGGDLVKAILLPPVIEEEAIETTETSGSDIIPDSTKEELENEETIATTPEIDQNNISEEIVNKFIPTTPLNPSNNIDIINKELPEDFNREHMVQEVAVAVEIVEEFISKKNSNDTTSDIDVKKKA